MPLNNAIVRDPEWLHHPVTGAAQGYVNPLTGNPERFPWSPELEVSGNAIVRDPECLYHPTTGAFFAWVNPVTKNPEFVTLDTDGAVANYTAQDPEWIYDATTGLVLGYVNLLTGNPGAFSFAPVSLAPYTSNWRFYKGDEEFALTPWNDLTRAGLGTRIGPTGLVEYGPHNLLLNSATLATQNVTTTAQQYTLKFSGAGSVTLSGTGSGTFSAGTNTFTATAGTLTLTVSGAVTTAQLNVGAAATDYVETTGVVRYLPRITFKDGASQGPLVEGQATNEINSHSLVSPQMVTQTVTVTAAQRTISFYGTGTVTISGAHVATVVGTGAYPTRTTLTFTPSEGSLTMTVSGAVQYPQLQLGSVAGSYIPNPGTGTAVRVADDWYLSGGALTAAWAEIVAAGAGTVVVEFMAPPTTVNGIGLVSHGSAKYLLYTNAASSIVWCYDGTNSAGATPGYTAGQVNKAAITFNASNMRVACQGVSSVETGHTGSFLSPTNLILGQLTPGGAYPLNSTIKSVRILPGYRTSAELAALTA